MFQYLYIGTHIGAINWRNESNNQTYTVNFSVRTRKISRYLVTQKKKKIIRHVIISFLIIGPIWKLNQFFLTVMKNWFWSKWKCMVIVLMSLIGVILFLKWERSGQRTKTGRNFQRPSNSLQLHLPIIYFATLGYCSATDNDAQCGAFSFEK